MLYWIVHKDGQGSVTAITDSAGNIVERYEYTPYGEPTIKDSSGNVIAESSIGNSLMFCGYYYDKETGLYYLINRYYDPVLGRFTSTDPLGYLDDLNLYCYVGNSPLNWVDPYGLFRFGKRGLGGTPLIEGLSTNPQDDAMNTELVHEHGFYEDGTGDDVGFRKSGRYTGQEDQRDYLLENKHYDDDIMREAARRLKDGDYSTLGEWWKFWDKNRKPKNNCQDWCDRLRAEYEKVKKEREQQQKQQKKTVCK